LLLDDQPWIAELGRWAHQMPRPKSVLMISAHWLDAPVTLGAIETVPLVYDFYGFPKKYYDVTYPAPGAPELAKRVRELLSQIWTALTGQPVHKPVLEPMPAVTERT